MWQDIHSDGENEDILREVILETRKIIENNEEIDWRPDIMSKLTGITEGKGSKEVGEMIKKLRMVDYSTK